MLRRTVAAAPTSERFRKLWFKARHSQLTILAFFALGTLVFSAVGFWAFERNLNENVVGVGSGFKWVTLTLLAQSSPWDIVTDAGTFLYYVVLIAGVSLVALGTGAVASKILEVVLRKGSGMADAKTSNHIVICGWSSKGDEIIRELHAEEVKDKRPVVILAQLESSPTRDEFTTFVRGNPNTGEDLMRAGIDRADTAIVLADQSNPVASSEDQDARTLLTTLAIESINPNCYTCVEVVKGENRQHFDRTKADELVVSAELTGALLASSAVTHGLSRVVGDLITHPVGNEFYYIPAPENVVGKTFVEALGELKTSQNCILMAIATGTTQYDINPPADRLIGYEDRLLVIAGSEVVRSSRGG
jgi:voltage-gated potassium channel